MHTTWSQMSTQKKNIYYKRVIDAYTKPNRDVVISSTNGNQSSFSSHDYLIGFYCCFI